MLKLKYLFENFELAKLALANWNHDEKSLDAYLKYFRISSNAIYPFNGCGKKCFLRLAPVEEKQEQNLRGELEFLQYLQKNNYPSMRPVASQIGKLLVQLDTKWGQYYASVFEGVPGKPIEDTDYSADLMMAYGKALGRLHSLSKTYEPTCKKWSYEDVLAWIRKTLQTYHAPEHMLQKADKVELELSALERNIETYGLIHYDFEPDNVFYDETSGECHVIDFEDGMYHFYLLDIEQVFDSLSEELTGDSLKQAKESFVQGYQSEMVLDADYEQKLPIMRRFCNLYAYTRLTRCIADEVADAPEWMCNLRKKLEEKRKQLEQL